MNVTTPNVDTIIQGDCLEEMKKLPDKSIDAIVTDPPFAFAGGLSNGSSSQTDSQFFAYWWKDVCKELNRVMKPEGEGFIWCDWKTAAILANGFKPTMQTYDVLRVSQMLYHYREMPGQGKPFRSSVDMIAYIRAAKSTGHRIPATTHNHISKYWYYGKHEFHPAEKDPELCEMLIGWCSDPGAIILDPFSGSGTTAIACKRSGRHFVGIELSEEYAEIARKRIESTPANLDTFSTPRMSLNTWALEGVKE
jgi:site-specific DNA-methyltransferase (adenine-specific)